MADLGHPKPHMVLARLDIQIDEQGIQVQSRELRLAEIDEEKVRVAADAVDGDEKGDVAEAEYAKAKDKTTVAARKLSINLSGLRLAAKQKRFRLLELDDEREQVLNDIEDSKTVIARLRAEQVQQEARLKES